MRASRGLTMKPFVGGPLGRAEQGPPCQLAMLAMRQRQHRDRPGRRSPARSAPPRRRAAACRRLEEHAGVACAGATSRPS